MGELKKAEDCYRRAIALDSHEASYYTALASLLKKENPADLGEPVRLLEQALALTGCGKTLPCCHFDSALREKNLALRIFMNIRDSSSSANKNGGLLGMTAPTSFSAAC